MLAPVHHRGLYNQPSKPTPCSHKIGLRGVIMRRSSGGRLARPAFAAVFVVSALVVTPARANVVVQIDKSSQRMAVSVDGAMRYSWPVSTARRGYRTPTGTFKPTALAVWHRSTIYSGSPMPHAIFFRRGYAIHGSY